MRYRGAPKRGPREEPRVKNKHAGGGGWWRKVDALIVSELRTGRSENNVHLIDNSFEVQYIKPTSQQSFQKGETNGKQHAWL